MRLAISTSVPGVRICYQSWLAALARNRDVNLLVILLNDDGEKAPKAEGATILRVGGERVSCGAYGGLGSHLASSAVLAVSHIYGLLSRVLVRLFERKIRKEYGVQLMRKPRRVDPEKLKALRLAAGLSQEELAQEANMTGKTVHRLEAGYTGKAHRLTVLSLAEALGVEPAELLIEE
jgi:DNA-binding XRE family transcriptional regulator